MVFFLHTWSTNVPISDFVKFHKTSTKTFFSQFFVPVAFKTFWGRKAFDYQQKGRCTKLLTSILRPHKHAAFRSFDQISAASVRYEPWWLYLLTDGTTLWRTGWDEVEIPLQVIMFMETRIGWCNTACWETICLLRCWQIRFFFFSFPEEGLGITTSHTRSIVPCIISFSWFAAEVLVLSFHLLPPWQLSGSRYMQAGNIASWQEANIWKFHFWSFHN